jgi:predicted neuraminidase
MSVRRPSISKFALCVAALVAGFVPWWNARQVAESAFPGFAVAPPQEQTAAPFFRKTVVNPSSMQAKSHSASLVQTMDGTMFAAWYAGSGEGAADVAIYLAKADDAGNWQEPRAIITRERAQSDLGRNVVSLGNPLLIADGGRLGLLFVTIAAGRWSGSSMNIAWSEDGGETWSQAKNLTMNPLGNLSALPRNPPAPLVGGGWAVPVYEEFLGKFPEILWLRPRGGNFEFAVSRIAGGVSVLQPSLIPLSENAAVCLMRDFRPAKWMRTTATEDAGRTWTAPQATELPNKDSGVCGVRLPDGTLLAAYNDRSTGKRENLRLAVSRDNGATWKTIATLEEEPGVEFSYPYMLCGGDGTVRMLYSARQTQIVYAEFNTAWLKEQEAAR